MIGLVTEGGGGGGGEEEEGEKAIVRSAPDGSDNHKDNGQPNVWSCRKDSFIKVRVDHILILLFAPDSSIQSQMT